MKPKLVNIYKFHLCPTLLRRPGIEPGTFAVCRTTLPTSLSKPSVSLSGHVNHNHHRVGQITRIVALREEGRKYERLIRATRILAPPLISVKVLVRTLTYMISLYEKLSQLIIILSILLPRQKGMIIRSH